MTRCSMGVGCDEAGVCYADAHGEPEKCPLYEEKMMEEVVEITESDLAAALEAWEKEAIAQEWPKRTDDQRHRDNARYLLGLIRQQKTQQA